MARRWDEESEDTLIDDAMRVLIATYTIERLLDRMREASLRIMRGPRERGSRSAGMPCAEFDFNAEPERQTHDVAVEDEGMHDEPPSRPL